jgi:hypothetical protein
MVLRNLRNVNSLVIRVVVAWSWMSLLRCRLRGNCLTVGVCQRNRDISASSDRGECDEKRVNKLRDRQRKKIRARFASAFPTLENEFLDSIAAFCEAERLSFNAFRERAKNRFPDRWVELAVRAEITRCFRERSGVSGIVAAISAAQAQEKSRSLEVPSR